jgi:hypothetical protein
LLLKSVSYKPVEYFAPVGDVDKVYFPDKDNAEWSVNMAVV